MGELNTIDAMARPATIIRMEIAGFVVAALALIASFASALYALGANRRADEANRTAKAALDLQSRIDEREREYRDVDWTADWDEQTGFALANSGLTDATHVTLIMRGFHGAERHDLGDIPAGGSVAVESVAAAAWIDENKQSMPLSPPYLVHWSSPLGVAEQREVPSRSLYMLPDDYSD